MRTLLSRRIDPATMTTRQRWSALAMLSGALLLVMMDMTILIMALPNLVADLASTSTEQLWIVDSYSLILAGLIIPMSALADRWGRKKMLLTGFLVFGLISALVFFAQASAHVIILRAALGAAGAMIMPTTLSMLRTVFPDPAERARALAIWSATVGFGAIMGPLVGGTLLEFFTWHAAFLINVPVVLIALIAGIFLLPESKDPNPPRWDALATLLCVAGMVGIVWGIKSLAKNGWDSFEAWGLFAAGALLMVVFVVRCLKSAEPLLEVRLFKSKPFTAGILAALTSSLAMGGILFLVAQWLQIIAQMTPILAGLALLPMALGTLIASPIAPRIAEKVGARTVLAAGLAIAGLGMMSLFFAGELTSYWQFVLPLACVGAGTGSLAIASAIVMGSTPEAKAGNAAALEEAVYDVGNVLGVAILGSAAAALYRAHLNVQDFAARGLSPEMAASAEESLVGALGVSQKQGVPDLAQMAQTAFSLGIGQSSLVGGMVLLLASVLVFVLVPKRFSLGSH